MNTSAMPPPQRRRCYGALSAAATPTGVSVTRGGLTFAQRQLVNDLDSHFAAEAELITELHVEQRQRLEQPRVLQRPGVDRIEADVLGELDHRLFRSLVVGRDKGGQLL